MSLCVSHFMKLCSKIVTLQDICKTREMEKQSKRKNEAQDNKNERNGNERPTDPEKDILKLCMLPFTVYCEVLVLKEIICEIV